MQWNSFNFYLSTFGVISDHIDDLRRKIIGPWLQPLRSKTFFACRFLVNIQECTVMYFEQQLGGDICHFIIFFCLRIIIDRSNHRFGENTSYPFVFLRQMQQRGGFSQDKDHLKGLKSPQLTRYLSQSHRSLFFRAV